MLENMDYLDLLEEDQSSPEVQYQLGLCYLEGRGVEANAQRARAWMQEAANQGYEPAVQALHRQEAAESVNEKNLAQWCARAEQGDGEAMYQVALYLRQHPIPGTERDISRYLEGAAEQGQGDACLLMAKELLAGGNNEKGIKYLTRAAECSVREAMQLLGECCAEGKGVARDPARAEAWFVRAAEQGQGDARCMMELSLRYKQGRGVEASFVKALSWKQRAQDAGLEEAPRLFEAELLEDGWNLQKYLERARQGDAESQYRAGRCYVRGDGVSRNAQQAEVLLAQAAEQGHMDAMNMLAELLEQQNRLEEARAWRTRAIQGGDKTQTLRLADNLLQGDEASIQQALNLLQELANQGLAQAQVKLGCCLEKGIGCQVNQKQSAEWYRRAAEQGDKEGQWRWGRALWGGYGVPRDLEAAGACLEKAALQGSTEGMRFLGVCYSEGYHRPSNSGCDVNKMIYWYEKACEREDEVALNNLGLIYRDGNGVPKNEQKGFEYIKRAAEKGSIIGQMILGDCYYDGKGVPKDLAQAAHWYLKAAESGNADSCYRIGTCYLNGTGVLQDQQRAYQWFLKGAEQNNGSSTNMVGRCYEEGWGVERNIAAAIEWFKQAMKNGSTAAAYNLADIYKKQGPASGHQEEIPSLYEKAARAGLKEAQCELGICYEEGLGVDTNWSQAVQWYQKASEAGNANATYRLGIMYLNGRGVPQDTVRAQELLCKAAQNHHADAANMVGRCSEEGWGCNQDMERAINWYNRAMEWGQPLGAYNLGNIYLDGRDASNSPAILIDRQQACYYFKKGAEMGHGPSLNMVGRCYTEGWGVPQDLAQAVQWYEKAIQKGVGVAFHNLGRMYLYGEAIPQDSVRAVELFRMGAERGDPNSQFMLGECLIVGNGTPVNQAEAVEYYNKAADQGNLGGLNSLGQCCMNGTGIAVDEERALNCFTKAVEREYGPAMYSLGEFWETHPQRSPKNLEFALNWYRRAAEKGVENAAEAAKRVENLMNNGTSFGDLARGLLGGLFGKK